MQKKKKPLNIDFPMIPSYPTILFCYSQTESLFFLTNTKPPGFTDHTHAIKTSEKKRRGDILDTKA